MGDYIVHVRSIICCVLLCGNLFGSVLSLAVMSVDLGSEWMKIAVVSPGRPMEICLNRDSQRKTPVIVAFRDGERHFGDLALSTQTKFPSKAFSDFLDLIGKPIDHPIVQDYAKRFSFHNLSSDHKTGGVLFTHPEGMSFSVEELVAMVLKQAQATAQATAGQIIKDIVLTVPVFFNQAERKALARAVRLAELNLLQLINANTAVALNYGAFRRKEFNSSAVNILFYDMGTGSTTATVVSYQTGKTKDRGYVETAPIMTVKGVGFDRNLGGLEFKMRLGNHLADQFDELKKASKRVRDVDRAMFKLYKEAERVKKILSANTEINAQVENVMEDIDLKVTVSRQQFEEMCTDLFARVTQPIDDALASSEIPLEDISQVIVVGGSTRIPKVQLILEEYLQGAKLAKSINADEAAAMGGAYQAAYLTKGFKVKTFVTKDACLYPIQVEFTRDGSKNIQRVVFGRNNEFPKKKTILASRMENDFVVFVNYGDLSFLPGKDAKSIGKSTNISSVLIKGVANSLAKHSSAEAQPKGVRMHMNMDASGIFYVEHAETLFEKVVAQDDQEGTLSKMASTIGMIFGSGNQQESNTGDVESEASKENITANTTGSTESLNQTKTGPGHDKTAEQEIPASTADFSEPVLQQSSDTKESKNSAVKKIEVKEALESFISELDAPVLAIEDFDLSLNKLKKLDAEDRARQERDKAVNALESFIHETKDKLSGDEYIKASTDDERKKIIDKLDKKQEWLEYASDAANTEEFKNALSSLTDSITQLVHRVNEHRDRPQAVESLKKLLSKSTDYLTELKAIPEEDSIFTQTEIEALSKLIKESSDWLNEQLALQDATPLSESPKITLKDIFEKIQELAREVEYLKNKARYAVPKKKTEKDPVSNQDSKPESDTEAEKIKLSENAPQDTQETDVNDHREGPEANVDPTAGPNEVLSDETADPLGSPSSTNLDHTEL